MADGVRIVPYKGLFITQPEPSEEGGALIITDFKLIGDRLEIIDNRLSDIDEVIDEIQNGGGVVTIEGFQEVIGGKLFNDLRVKDIENNHLMVVNASGRIVDSGYSLSDLQAALITVRDEGTVVTTTLKDMNFIGEDVSVYQDGDQTQIYIPAITFAPFYNQDAATVPNVSTSSRSISDPTTEGNPFKIGDWTAGTAHPSLRDTTLTFNTPAKCSFIDKTTTISVVVYDANGSTMLATHSVGPVLTNLNSTDNNITIQVAGFVTDFVRYKAHIYVSIDISSILPNGGRFSVVITHNNSGTSYTKTQSGVFYDTDVETAALTGVSITENTPVIRSISGLNYYDLGSTFDFGISDIDYINYLSYPQPFINVETDEYGIADFNLSSGSLTSWTSKYDNVNASHASTQTITQTNYRFIGTDANVQARTVDWTNGSWVPSPDDAILIDTYTSSSDDVFEDFNDEIERRTSIYSAWTSTSLLGSNALMVQGGLLKRQEGNWTTYSPTNTANYTGNTNNQFYYRGFRDNGISHTNGIFTLTGPSETDLTNDDILIEISLDNVDWYNCNEEYTGGVLNDGDGCRINSDTITMPSLSFTLGAGKFTDSGSGPDGWGIYIRISMPNGSTVELQTLAINW
jgi:hypothetical protein